MKVTKKKIISMMILCIIAVVMAGIGYAECPSGIVSYWTFDDGTAVDTIGNNDGTNHGGVTTGVAGQVGNAFSFDGDGDYIEIDDSSDLDFGVFSFTISGWINGNGCFVSKGDPGSSYNENLGWNLFGSTVNIGSNYDPANYISINSMTNTNDGNWHHLAFVREGSGGKVILYVDGIEENNTDDSAYDISNSAKVIIASHWKVTNGGISTHPAYFTGLIDEVAIFNRALSASEVHNLYNNGLNGIGYCSSPILNYSNFASDSDTTNFSDSGEVPDITNVTNMTLAITDKGKIKFAESTEINADGENYDTNIVIEDEFISVDTATLDSSFNTSATITLEGVTCPNDVISYAEGTFATKADIIAVGRNCELDGVCSNKQCLAGTLTFDVAHFTGFAAGSNANLTIQAEAGIKYANDPIEFTADYINSTSGIPISGECNITFDDDWGTWYTMTFDNTDYNYTKASGFATTGTHDYNVTCSGTGYVTLMANDTKIISSIDIPEFSSNSILFLTIGMLIVGFVFVKRRR